MQHLLQQQQQQLASGLYMLLQQVRFSLCAMSDTESMPLTCT
jgi:hypothetical protein